jgi:two-component system sensor kinase FixL
MRHREELAHVSRVVTLGELAASIAHELNQPLSAIVVNAHAAQRLLDPDVGDPNEARAALVDIAADARRAGDVIASMRSLLQRGEMKTEPVHIERVLTEVIELLRSESIARGVTVRLVPPIPPLPPVPGDPTQLKQVFLNVLVNGIEAASRGRVGRPEVVVEVSSGAEELEVAVRDTGPGLPTDDPEELFAPFVSHRPGGLGMGLAITRTIVEAHGGRVHGASDPAGGAVFTVSLPCAEGSA